MTENASVQVTPRNPKQAGSNLFDAKPQRGLCPIRCDECFYNRPGAFYVDPDAEVLPTLEEVGDGIVRVNCGHDSNQQRELVLEKTAHYPHRFYNTSVAAFTFPAPVVFTANRREELPAAAPPARIPPGLMFIRLRVSPTNLYLIERAVDAWGASDVPIVLTFMAYYSKEPPAVDIPELAGKPLYEWRVRHVNSYWCPNRAFCEYVFNRMQARPFGGVVRTCGTLDSSYCKDCRNCETLYWPALKRMRRALKREQHAARSHERGMPAG